MPLIFRIMIACAALLSACADPRARQPTTYDTGPPPDGAALAAPAVARWRATSSPTREALNGVWAAGVSAAWAVGAQGTILRFDGLRWQLAHTPTEATLHAVWGASPTQIYAAGEMGVLLSSADGRFFYNDKSPEWRALRALWGRRAEAAAGGATAGSTAPAAALWAVGDDGVVLQKRDGAWSRSDSPTGLSLRALWGDATRLYAVGVGDVFVRHGDGAFARAHSSGIATFTGVWGSGSDDVWVSSDRGELSHFDGARWAIAFTARDAGGASGELSAIHGRSSSSSSSAWAVGAGDDGFALVLRFDGRSWQVDARLAGVPPLRAVFAVSADTVFAVGDDGVILRRSAR